MMTGVKENVLGVEGKEQLFYNNTLAPPKKLLIDTKAGPDVTQSDCIGESPGHNKAKADW